MAPSEVADGLAGLFSITQRRSANGTRPRQRETLRSLGPAGHRQERERPDGPQLRGMIRSGRAPGRGDDEQASRRRSARGAAMAERIGLHSIAPPRGARKPRKRVGRGAGIGLRQDLRARLEGRGLALGQQAQARLRGRPEAAPHADAQAARPAHEEVDAVRAVPDAHPAGQPLRSEPLRRGRRGHSRQRCASKGLAKRKRVPVKMLAKGELERKNLTVSAHAFSAARARRSRRRAAPAPSSSPSESGQR